MSLSRATYIGLALLTVGIGLVVHLRGAGLGPAARDVIADALWASMIVWWAGALAPAARPPTRGVAAYLVCVAVEVGQLYHAPALDAVRATHIGHLLLGSGFDPRDFASYALGVALAVLTDEVVRRRRLGIRVT